MELTGEAVSADLPELLTELSEWLESRAPPGSPELRAVALRHVVQRLDQAVDLQQLLREFRLLRETIIRALLRAEQDEQALTQS